MRLLLTLPLLLPAVALADHHDDHSGGDRKMIETESEEGFVPLFDGESISEFVQRGGKAEYRVEDGAIVGKAVPKTPNSFLCTPRDYGDFEFRCRFKVDPRLNSGIMFRAQSREDYKDGRVHGYQAEIDPSPRAYTGGIYDEARRGWLNDLSENKPAREAFREEDWNDYRIRAVGNHIRTWINGVPAAELVDDTDRTGFIGLQVHSIKGDAPEPPMEVRWTDLRIKELSPAEPQKETKKE